MTYVDPNLGSDADRVLTLFRLLSRYFFLSKRRVNFLPILSHYIIQPLPFNGYPHPSQSSNKPIQSVVRLARFEIFPSNVININHF